MLVIRGVPLLITWPGFNPFELQICGLLQRGRDHSHLRLVWIWGVQLPVTLTLELSPYCEARSHLSYHCEAHSQFTLAEVVRLTHIYITSVRLTHTYIKVMVYILFMTFNCACAQMILYVTFNCTCARMIRSCFSKAKRCFHKKRSFARHSLLGWSDFGSKVYKVWQSTTDSSYKATYLFWLCVRMRCHSVLHLL